MTAVRLSESITLAESGKTFPAGSVVLHDFSDDFARDLIANGSAVEVVEVLGFALADGNPASQFSTKAQLEAALAALRA